MSLFADSDPTEYAFWRTLLDKAPASWHDSIKERVTRSTLGDALKAAVLLDKYETDGNSYRVFRFRLDANQQEPAYPISFLSRSGSATLRVTEDGNPYEVERDETAHSTYPHSKRRMRRRLDSDIAHELGHAIAAEHVGWKVSTIVFTVDSSRSPAVATGISKTNVVYNNDPEKMLLVSTAGAVAECQFDGKQIELYSDPMRVFETYEDYQSDLLKAVNAYGDEFTVKLFVEGVQQTVQFLKPFAGAIRAAANDRAKRAAESGCSELTIVWDEEIRRALGLLRASMNYG